MNFQTETNANHEPLSALDIYARFRERLRSLPKTATSSGDEHVATSPAAYASGESIMETRQAAQTPPNRRGDGKDDGRPSRKPPIVHIPHKSLSQSQKKETSNVVQISGLLSLFEEDEDISEDELRDFLSKLDWSRLHE